MSLRTVWVEEHDGCIDAIAIHTHACHICEGLRLDIELLNSTSLSFSTNVRTWGTWENWQASLIERRALPAPDVSEY